MRITNMDDLKHGLLGLVLTEICFIITLGTFDVFLFTSVFETGKIFILFCGLVILIIISGYSFLCTMGAFLSSVKEAKS